MCIHLYIFVYPLLTLEFATSNGPELKIVRKTILPMDLYAYRSTSPPPNAICMGRQTLDGMLLWSIVADTPHGAVTDTPHGALAAWM